MVIVIGSDWKRTMVVSLDAVRHLQPTTHGVVDGVQRLAWVEQWTTVAPLRVHPSADAVLTL